MTEVIHHPPGTFCWVDLSTHDTESATDFYTQIFGWTSRNVPLGEAGMYTMLEKNGKSVAALWAMTDDMRAQHIPPYWQSYVCVSSADEIVQKAGTLGGAVLQPADDVMEAGRVAVVQDATGATIGLWQPNQEIGTQLINEPGSPCWNELYTRDPETSAQFYAALFGWTTKTSKGATGEDYTEFMLGDRPVAGMLEIRPEWGDIPPNWSVYFAVEDCDAAIDHAKRLGAKVEMPPMDIENVGRFTLLQDLQGAHFMVIELRSAD